MSRLLFEARAAVLACEAQQALIEKEIELEKLKQQRKPLTDEQAHQTLLDMAAHIEDFGNENTTDEQLSGECIRFILERVIASGTKGKE